MVNTMSLLLGPMRQHIPGFKELSEHKDIIEVRPGKEILIPLFANHSQNFELLVKEGDQVFIGTKLAVCEERMTVPIYSSVSGIVKGVRKVMHASLKPVAHVVIEPDGKQERVQAFAPIDPDQASREELTAVHDECGHRRLRRCVFPVLYEVSRGFRHREADHQRGGV